MTPAFGQATKSKLYAVRRVMKEHCKAFCIADLIFDEFSGGVLEKGVENSGWKKVARVISRANKVMTLRAVERCFENCRNYSLCNISSEEIIDRNLL